MVSPYEVLEFWLEEVGPKGWYIADTDLDGRIADRFGAAWEAAAQGKFAGGGPAPKVRWPTSS